MRNGTQKITEILLIGNPNAGKSTLFNKLTGAHAKVGNWHGVTVGASVREAELSGSPFSVCDLPGIYSLTGMSMEEKSACAYIKEHSGAVLIFVAECATLSRAMPLFAQLSQGRRAALVLTKRRQFERAGGVVNVSALADRLRIPVFSAEDFNKRELKEKIARIADVSVQKGDWSLPADVYRPQREGLSRADKLLTNGFFCIPFFFALLVLAFYITFAPAMPGDFMKNAVESFFAEYLYGFAQKIPSPVLRGFVADGLLTSLGGVLCFLPQIALLFFFLILMEESGFLSRLAMLTDGVFAKIGMSGRAMFSVLMGFGCTAAAILTTRGLDDKKIQRRVILCLPYISCSAKLPVYLTLASSFFPNPFYAVMLLYALGVGLSVLAAVFLKGEDVQPFVMELAPLQIPKPLFVLKSLFFQIKQFIIKLSTVILAFFLASWILSSFNFSFEYCGVEQSMLATLCGGLKYLFAPIGMNDWKIAYAALSGLVAKENVAGALALFYGGFPYSAESAFAFAVFILACSPCVSAIAASAREVGWKHALLYAVLQTASALLLSYVAYFALCGGVMTLVFAAIPFAVLCFIGKNRVEKIRRKRRNHASKLYR